MKDRGALGLRKLRGGGTMRGKARGARPLHRQVGEGACRHRPAGGKGDLLDPERLLRPAREGSVGLDKDGLDHPLPGDVREILRHRMVASLGLVGAEDARLHRRRERGQLGPPPDVETGVDHGAGAEPAP